MAYGFIYPHLKWLCGGDSSSQEFTKSVTLAKKKKKKTIRAIAKLRTMESSKKAFKDLEILTLPTLYIYQAIIYNWFKCKPVYIGMFTIITSEEQFFLRYEPHRPNIYPLVGDVLINKPSYSLGLEEQLNTF